MSAAALTSRRPKFGKAHKGHHRDPDGGLSFCHCALGRTRIFNPIIRNHVLYPAELQGRIGAFRRIKTSSVLLFRIPPRNRLLLLGKRTRRRNSQDLTREEPVRIGHRIQICEPDARPEIAITVYEGGNAPKASIPRDHADREASRPRGPPGRCVSRLDTRLRAGLDRKLPHRSRGRRFGRYPQNRRLGRTGDLRILRSCGPGSRGGGISGRGVALSHALLHQVRRGHDLHPPLDRDRREADL